MAPPINRSMTFSVPVSCSRLVVTEQQRLGLERQVAVGDGDPQRRFFWRLRRVSGCRRRGRRRRGFCHDPRDRGIGHRAPQQPAIGQALARVDAVQRLLPAEQRVDEKVHGFRLREKVDVRDRIGRQVAARPEAADPRRRNERGCATDRCASRLPTARPGRWRCRRTDRCRRPAAAAASCPSAGSWRPARNTRRRAARADSESPRSARRRRPSNADPEDRPTHDWPATPGRWRRTPRPS